MLFRFGLVLMVVPGITALIVMLYLFDKVVSRF